MIIRRILLYVAATLTFSAPFVTSYKILALFPYPLQSHMIMFDSLTEELASRGHEITMVTPYPKLNRPGIFKQINVSGCMELPNARYELDNAFSYHSSLLRDMFQYVAKYDGVFQCPTMKGLMTSNETYDLLITELFSSDAMLAFVTKFKAPFISFCSTTLLTWGSDRVGHIDNPSHVSFTYSSKPLDLKRPTFGERLYNVYAYVAARLLYKLQSELLTDSIVRNFFGPDVPPMSEIAKNTSLILTFSHFSINTPRPMIPGVVEVSGIQIKDSSSSLPKELQTFLDEAEHGVIYFCLGSLLKTKTIPPAKLHALLEVFSKLKERVLWKFEEDDLPGRPNNVMIRKWMPQRNILAHPNVKLFISHGGALSLNEAVYEGVPILGIPFWVDQTLNVKTLTSLGVAELLEYPEISVVTLEEKISLLLDNRSYKENMKKLSAVFRERAVSALDTAVYWTEYVIRHKGAKHLRSASTNLYWYQYILLDVVLCFIAIVLLNSFVLYLFIRLVSKLRNNKEKSRLYFKKLN